MVNVTIGLSHDCDGPLRTNVIACAASSAQLDVNRMRLFFLSLDGSDRALTLAKTAAITEFGRYGKLDQGAADACRASFFSDMRIIFIPEIAQSGKHGV